MDRNKNVCNVTAKHHARGPRGRWEDNIKMKRANRLQIAMM